MTLLTRLAFRWRALTILAMLLVMAGGAFTLTRMQIELFPDIDFPLITVSALYPTADPETVLQDITIPVENAVFGLSGLKSVRSTSAPNLSFVLAEFEFGTDMKEVKGIIARNLENMPLPPGVQPPRIARANPDEFPILQLSILRPGDLSELSDLVTSQVLPEIRKALGVFSAEFPLATEAGTSITRTNGQPSLVINVLKEPDANTVSVVDRVMERLEEIKATLPADLEIVTIVNQAPEIQASIESIEREATLGALFAVAVIFLFLLSIRPTLVTGIAIPTSILGGLIIMGWQGMSLNIVTLGGLAIAVGRVVDDSIVVLENIYRHIQQGGDRIKATLAATREVVIPITTSTLTTIAVFAPLLFVGGIIGTFFTPFALTVTFALLASLVVALTVVPVLATIFIRPGDASGEQETWLQRVYTPMLRWALAHKGLTLLGTVLLFIGSLGLLASIPQTFLPGADQSLLTVDVTLPPGTTLDVMLAEDGPVEQVEGVLGRLRVEGTVDAYMMTIGSSGFEFGPGAGGGSGGYNTASIFVRLTDDADVEDAANLLQEGLKGPDRSVSVSQVQGGGPQSNALELTLTGEDYSLVSTTAGRIVKALQEMNGLENVGSDAPAVDPALGSLSSPSQISRFNGQQAVRITGTITETNTQAVNRAVSSKVEEIGLPAGVELEKGGVFSDIEEAFSRMGIAIVAGIVLVYLVMVVSQRSLITPFVIILSLPLASIGALGALFITQRTLGLPALIGILMLIGLVVTNAIVLIAFVEQLRHRGLSIYDALVQGGRTRLRPILMTAFTTSFALVPLAVTVTKGGIIGAELATVVIGGLMTSTFLTLVVIPVIYSLFRRDRATPQVAGGSEVHTSQVG